MSVLAAETGLAQLGQVLLFPGLPAGALLVLWLLLDLDVRRNGTRPEAGGGPSSDPPSGHGFEFVFATRLTAVPPRWAGPAPAAPAGAAVAARPAPEQARRADILAGVVVLSAGAAAIHAGATGAHLRESLLFGLFFVVVAILQVAWAAWVVTDPSSLALFGGALGNAAVAMVWLVSRTWGVPVGPTPGRPEGVGAAGALATCFELAMVVGCVALWNGERARRPSTLVTGTLRGPIVAAAVLAATTAAVLAGGH